MKTKKLEKKISLNKTTIANLDQNAMGGVQGGANFAADYKTKVINCDTERQDTCSTSISSVYPTRYNCSVQIACVDYPHDDNKIL
ncbi:MAG: hypothetical protein GY765_05900 [bacterium]|nr:hypothetical protein [bacterium]